MMIISRKGHVITEAYKDYLLTLSLTHLIISDLNTDEQIRSIELDGMLNLNLVQLIPIGDSILIFDVEKGSMIHVDETGVSHQVMFPRRVTAGRFVVTQSDNFKLLLFNGLAYYEFDLENKILSEVSGVHVMKHYADFRHVMKDLFAIRYNHLFYDDQNRKVLYHFHDDQKVIYDDKDFGKPYYFHDDKNVSRIGIYDVNQHQKQVEFSAPETIAFGGWFEWTEDGLTPNQSVLKGVIASDKIILCYPQTIYVMDLSGKILQKLTSGSGKRFTGVNSPKADELLISEFSETEQLTEISTKSLL